MGRSKFPGKPSKSINRKRISVLQLEEEATSKEQTDDAVNLQRNNKDKDNCDDDDEKKGGSSLTTTTNANVVGSNVAESNATTATAPADSKSVNGNGGKTAANKNADVEALKNVGKKVTTAAPGSSSNDVAATKGSNDKASAEKANDSKAVVNARNAHKKCTVKSAVTAVAADNAVDDEKNVADEADDTTEKNNVSNEKQTDDEAEHDDDNDADSNDDDDDNDGDDANENNTACTSKSKKSLQTVVNSNSNFAATFAKFSNKKFKNLNLAKVDKMLPSSSKLKQQQQHRIASSTAAVTTKTTIAAACSSSNNNSAAVPAGNPFAADDVKATPTATDANDNCDASKFVASTSTKSNETDESTETNANVEAKNMTTSIFCAPSPSHSTSSCSSSTTTTNSTAKQKKTVTFKNVLETSDDKSAVKKFYNPDNRTPLVSIMKKDFLNRPLFYSRSSECIVRPSRLTEILKNNSNIDKLNSLKFRSAAATSSLDSATSNVFATSLSRAFGAPTNDKGETVNFGTSSEHKEDNATNQLNLFDKNKQNVNEAGAECADDKDLHKELNHDENDDTAAAADDDDEDDDEDEQQMIVDKHFVLPKRSTRSSRVIKPNKRLLEDGIICKKVPTASKAKVQHTNVAAIANPKKEQQLPLQTQQQQQPNYFGLREFTKGGSPTADTGTTLGSLGIKVTKEITSSDNRVQFPKQNLFSSSFALNKGNSFVLRQPRLQFDSLVERSIGSNIINGSATIANAQSITGTSTATSSLTSSLNKSLIQSICSNALLSSSTAFALSGSSSSTSLLNNSNNTMANSSNCSVCSTPVSSKNIQQASKYGMLACETCRKFISKITKKCIAASATPSLKQLQFQCKTDGSCSLQSHQKAHMKNFKKIYKERCSACWLRKCLQQLQFSSVQKQRLSSVLSTAFQQTLAADATELLSPTGSLFGTARAGSANTGAQIKWNSGIDGSVEALKINLKSSLLAENNKTFGSTPLLRPPILEKPMFIKSMDIKLTVEKKQEKLADASEVESKSMEQKQVKSKRKDKERTKDKDVDKERERDRDKEKLKSKEKDVVTETETDKDKEAVAQALELINANKAQVSSQVLNLESSKTLPVNASQDNNNANDSLSILHPSSPSSSNGTVAAAMISPTSDGSTKRQRIDLKGPRVKHVCRSASIVLGQPLATFGEELNQEEHEQQEDAVTSESIAKTIPADQTETTAAEDKMLTDENDNCASCQASNEVATTKVKSQTISEPEIEEPAPKAAKVALNGEKNASLPLQVSNKRNMQLQRSNSICYGSSINKKYMRQYNANSGDIVSVQQQQQQRRKEAYKSKALISIDFWENYDPAEVCQTGFGLIITETVAQRALCFLCGSTGLDPLLFCACCCEPYHQYCVMDEYNLKHSSMDDTMASLMDTSNLNQTVNAAGGADNLNHITNRLNWLCPRCTVCYTCNMSSGSKVKCQKCQKNYHSTCLGTSKRLLGADRPLICVNCLKCKSCGTTKVAKFVGNLPICTSCFRLRKKGNFCPICQKCYDDQDFDLKMMECGDCQQWVHSKCEGLTDEQYNLLSTLPECIEFICKKCARRNEPSKQRALEWRQAVLEEFKASLLSVLKLLSKSRQACALLKLSPRKQVRCNCNSQCLGRLQPKSLQFNGERDNLGSDGESRCSDDIYEFKDKCYMQEEQQNNANKCACLSNNNNNHNNGGVYGTQLSLVEIKRKICSNEYVSLAEFNYDMNQVIQNTDCDELMIAYKEILSEQFPWFQNETKACTDALEEDMFESCAAYALENSMSAREQFENDNDEDEDMQQKTADVVDLPTDIDDVLYSIKTRNDTRACLFCRKIGEGLSNEESRLLYCGHDCWVHINCAMWSAEVFEEIDGSLQNVHSAVARGRMIKCTVCGNRGASVGCNVKSCGEHYHYPCARSINCAFLTDKSMYCPEHAHDALKHNSTAVLETNFEVCRPVYVELDRKRKKLLEPAKVQFHIGSLEVRQLGTVVPRFSDNYEALVPINFLCSRLYWSIKEPWKIVEYTVRTIVQNSYASTLSSFDAGRNFTVDHSNANVNLVQLGLTQIARWHSSLLRGELLDGSVDSNAELAKLSKLLPDYLTHNQNSSSATDENTEEEPQNNADLLPPEIKEAIFEDLPHELLDGISMLDIFPLGNSDAKAEMFFYDQSKDGANANMQISDEDTVNTAFGKQLELSNSCSSNSLCMQLNSGGGGDDVIKRANKKVTATQHQQQRNWSTGSIVAIKRRKLSKELRVPESVLLSLNQQRSKKDAAAATVARRHSICTEAAINNKAFTWSAAQRYVQAADAVGSLKMSQLDGVDDAAITEFRIISADNGGVKCDRCHNTYRTYDSLQRHLANCEPFSTSESESEATSRTPESNVTSPLVSIAEGLSLHDLSKLTRTQANTGTGLPFIQAFPQSINLGNLQANINGIPIGSMQNLQGMQTMPNLQNFQGLQNIQLQNLQPQTLAGNFFISTANPASSVADEMQFLSNSLQGLTANLNGTYTLAPTNGFGSNTNTVAAAAASMNQPQAQLFALSTNADGSQQLIQLPSNTQQLQTSGNSNAFQTLQATNSDKKIVLPLSGKPIKTLATKAAQQASCAAKQQLKASNAVKPLQSKLTTTATAMPATPQQTTPITLINGAGGNATQLLGQNLLQQMQAAGLGNTHNQTQLLFQTANNAAGAQPQQQIIMQPTTMPQNIISFVTTDGGQNPQVQYLSIPSANDYKQATPQQTTPYITAGANSLLPGTAYLQTDASGNLMLTTTQTPTGLQMLSTTPQPQVIGTLIQPQTLQLSGNVLTSTEQQQQPQQVIIGATGGGLEMPQVILATQPMYYGLETIVQNTVMSSQQFMSTGMLSQNASFSATTTQVFQASKIEPLVDIPTGYVVLNNVDATNAPQNNNFLNAANVLAPTAAAPQQSNELPASVVSQAHSDAVNTLFRIQNANEHAPTATTVAATPLYQQQQPQQQTAASPSNVQIVTAKIPPQLTQLKRNNALKTTPVAAVTKVQPQVINKVIPTTIAQQRLQNTNKQQQQQLYQQQQQLFNATPAQLDEQQQMPKSNLFKNNIGQAIVVEQQQQQELYNVQSQSRNITNNANAAKPTTAVQSPRRTNMIRPIVKPKMMKNVKQQSQQQQLTGTKTALLKPQQQQQQQQFIAAQPTLQTVNNDFSATTALQNNQHKLEYVTAIPMQTVSNEQQQQNQQQQQQYCNGNAAYASYEQPLIAEQCYQADTQYAASENMNIGNMQQTEVYQQHTVDVGNILPATNRFNNSNSSSSNNNICSYNSNVPTNIVNPIQQQYNNNHNNSNSNNTAQQATCRPTNRVLPMQQKMSTTTTNTNTATTASILNSNKTNRFYERDNKICFETEIKKDFQSNMLPMTGLSNNTQQQQHQQQQQQQQQQVMQLLQEQQVEYEKSMQCENDFIENSFKCQMNTLDAQQQQQQNNLSCQQQLDIVVNNLQQQYNDSCYTTQVEKSKEHELILASTPEQAYSDMACNDEEDIDDEDDDDFSLKMHAEDEDQDISDSDEPAVKEKISKILDNLTNEDCADSLATATTLEATAELNSSMHYMQSPMQQDMATPADNYETEMSVSQYDVSSVADDEENAAAVANEYITQMTENINAAASATTPSYEHETLEAKLSPQHPTVPTHNEQQLEQQQLEATNCANATTATAELCTLRKPTPHPPHPARDPKKITGPHLLYEIQSEDGFTYKSTSIAEVWEKVFEAVQVARRAHGLAPLPEGPLADMSGVQMIGLKTNALKYLIEQLPGVEKCNKYTPKYHQRRTLGTQQRDNCTGGSNVATNAIANANHCVNSTLDYLSDHEDLHENMSEFARGEAFSKRSDYDMFSWLASRHRKQPVQVFVQPSDTELIPRRGTGSNLPMAMKYRTLKETYKEYVGVFRSHIHGRGLYCTKDIEAGEMVIEYAGELIRSTLTDKRERYYNSRGIGCYMFKIDDNLVVDATMRGNAARFINHSCEPNCYSKVVDILGHKHIIIFALRRIVQGEELTYDYKFPFEDEKIPCSCGSKKCRKYLN